MRPPVLTGNWSEAERILAVRTDGIGDLLMTTPALRAIRHARPGISLSLLTSPAAADAAALLPFVDEVLVHEAPWVKASLPRPDPAGDLALIERLRTGTYDSAVIFTVNSQSPLPAALTCRLAGVGRRAAHCRENPYQLLTDWLPEPEPDQPAMHEVRRQLRLAAALGFPADDEHLSLRVPPDAVRDMHARLAGAGIDPRRPWILMHPGATAPSRRWPPERFAVVARELRARGLPVVVTGGPGDEAFVDPIVAAGATPLVGLAFADLCAAVTLASVLLANNSSAAHVAAAVGTPVVVLYALTNPQHRPWQVRSHVLFQPVPCAGCRQSVCPAGHHRCLLGVHETRALDAVMDLLEKRPAGPLETTPELVLAPA